MHGVDRPMPKHRQTEEERLQLDYSTDLSSDDDRPAAKQVSEPPDDAVGPSEVGKPYSRAEVKKATDAYYNRPELYQRRWLEQYKAKFPHSKFNDSKNEGIPNPYQSPVKGHRTSVARTDAG